MRVGIIISPDYQGTESGKTAYFGIDSNIPYWTATLVTSGTDVGTATTDDFSFESGNDAVHTTHGSNTQNIPIYVKRKEVLIPFVRVWKVSDWTDRQRVHYSQFHKPGISYVPVPN